MQNLKNLRKNKGLTQQECCELLSIPKTTFCYYEQGRTEPDIATIIKLADFFGCSVDYLLGHQTQSVLYLDNFTDSQRTLISMIKNLNEDQTNNLIGRASEMLNLPYSATKPVRPW